MRIEGAGAICAENAELRQRVAELEKELAKLKRKLKGELERNDPLERFRRKMDKDKRRRSTI